MLATGSGVPQSPSTTNWAAPEKTRALIKTDSATLRPACRASTPKTRPIAKPLISMGMHRLAPARAPERVKVTSFST